MDEVFQRYGSDPLNPENPTDVSSLVPFFQSLLDRLCGHNG